MSKSMIWPAPPPKMSFKLHLFIDAVENLPVDKLQDCHNSSLLVQIEWRGSGKRVSFLPKGFDRNYTKKQIMQAGGVVRWNEGFTHSCNIKKMSSKRSRSWIINLEIQEFNQLLKGKMSILGKAKVDLAELFAHQRSETSMRVPIICSIRGHTAEAVLVVKLQITEIQTSGSIPFRLPRAVSLRSLSCVRYPQTLDTTNIRLWNNQSTILPREESSSDDEPDFDYGKLAIANLFLVGQQATKIDYNAIAKESGTLELFTGQTKKQPSLARLLSLNKARISFGVTNNSKGMPLLNKTHREDGGDDIDNERRNQLSIWCTTSPEQTKREQDDNSQSSGFEDDNVFEVGNWERRTIISRDGQMELVADVFHASIDQRSERAAGMSACTVLAAVISDWLHKNPKALPIRCQFDELIRDGSSEWRKLCTNDNHREKFSDQHFDLDTVLEANIRPISVITDKSYIGFFNIANTHERFEFLQGLMSFDSIWNKIICTDTSKEQVYIISWNDHFFVLEVQSDAVYLIDTLGERLSEGCNQAYIIKFNKESRIYSQCKEPRSLSEESKELRESVAEPGVLDDELDQNPSRQVICEGKNSCKEYIKGFLAALPLRELQHDIEKGLTEKAPLHKLLQIEFHYTTPCDVIC